MKMNLSRTDREIRLLIAIGVISLLTSYAGKCPLYSMLKINTRAH